MKQNKIFRTLLIAVILMLLTLALPAAPAEAAVGTIYLSPTTGAVGTAVTVSGTGFTASTTFTVLFNTTTTVATGTVAAAGSLYAYFTVPALPRASYTVTVTTSAGDTSNTATFTITPSITLSATAGMVGDQFSVSGTSFTISSTVSIYFDSTVIASTYSDASGNLTAVAATVPETYGGAHTVKALDSSSIYSQSLTYTIQPKLTVSAAAIGAGSQLTVGGTGFSASSSLTYTIDGITANGSVTTAGANGSFASSAVTVPGMSGGAHTIKVQDSGGASAQATFTISANMTISPQSGPAGTTVTILGTAFGASRPVTLTFKNAAVTTNPPIINTDSSGNFSATFNVPTSVGGANAVTANDGVNSKSVNFTVTFTAAMNQPRGAVGSTANVTGSGFNPNGPVTIKFDNAQAGTGTADANGTLSANFTVPSSKSGNHTVTVSDGTNTQTFTFTTTSAINLKEPTGSVGGDVTLNGGGFNAPSATIVVKYDDAEVTRATTNDIGAFSVTFKAPTSKAGNHTITASDGANTSSITFAIESTPPPAPVLSAPPNDTKPETSLVKFDWQAVNDPSGVTYTFQLATDANFSVMVLQKTGLTTPTYQVTELEKLKSRSQKEPYYWRVRAIDGASNEGPWSTPATFWLGFTMPTWGWYGVFGFVAVLMAILGFILGRKSAFSY